MRILIDTNRYRDFCSATPEVVNKFRSAEGIYISFITLAELRAGFICGTMARKNERVLNTFMNRPRVQLVYANEDTVHHYATIFFQLRRQGTPIPTNDIWIASLATQYNLVLYSRDAHFDNLPQIPRI